MFTEILSNFLLDYSFFIVLCFFSRRVLVWRGQLIVVPNNQTWAWTVFIVFILYLTLVYSCDKSERLAKGDILVIDAHLRKF